MIHFAMVTLSLIVGNSTYLVIGRRVDDDVVSIEVGVGHVSPVPKQQGRHLLLIAPHRQHCESSLTRYSDLS